MEFTVGMKLTVRADLEEAEFGDETLFESGVVEEMTEYCLKEVTVARIRSSNTCFIKEDGEIYFWDKNMFKEFL